MNKGVFRLIFIFAFLFISTFSVSFAGKYDTDNTSLFQTISNRVAGSPAYASFTPTQQKEIVREVGLFSTYIKGYPQTQATVEQHQLELTSDFRNKILDPLRTSLTGGLEKAPYQLQEIISAEIMNTGPPNSIIDALASGGGPITTTESAKQESQANVEESVKPLGKCSSIFNASIMECLDAGISWIINNTLLQLAGFLVWLTANMFNYAIKVGVLDFAKWAPDSLYPIWIIIRQIVSLFIVFIGLYLGFMYILGRDEKFQKYIPWVIIFALFVNFSYPLARTAVDISNIVSLNVYSSAIGNNALTAGITSQNTAGALIMNRLGLQGLIMSATGENNGSAKIGALTNIDSVPGSLLAVAFVLYAAYIFLLATGIMVMRTAALIFLIIASPILFIDSVLPLLGEKAQLVRKIFFEQLAVGPVFMIMLALTLKFLEIFSTSGMLAAGGLTGAGSGDQTIKTFFNILMMLIMLHIMITVTKKVSGTIGEYATDAMGKVGGFGLGVATGGAGFLARGTLGRAAAAARDSKWVTNNQDSFMGRRAYNLSNSVANSTFDARNSSIVAGKMSKLGIGMGMGAKMGFIGANDARVKDIEERGNRIKTKYERTGIGADGKWHRKGEVDEEAVARKNEYFSNGGGAMFLTKENKAKLAEGVVEESAAKEFEKYKKASSRKEKEAFVANNKAKLEELKKTDPKMTAPTTNALAQAVFDAEKEEKEYKENFDKEKTKAIEEITLKSADKKQEFYSRQTKEIREAIDASNAYTKPTAPEKVSNGSKLGGISPNLDTASLDSAGFTQNQVEKPQPKNTHLSETAESAQKSPEAIREEKQVTATQVVQNEMKTNNPNKDGDTSSFTTENTLSKPSGGGGAQAQGSFLALAKKERELRAERIANTLQQKVAESSKKEINSAQQ